MSWKPTARPRWPRATPASTRSSTSWRRLPGYGIDNAIIELDANEPPIADGSAREFCKMIQSAGHRSAERTARALQSHGAHRTGNGRNGHDAVPGRGLQDQLHQFGPDRAGSPSFSASSLRRRAGKRICRTRARFAFYEEIEFLIKNGLIKGGSLENAVVIRDDAVLTTEPLRYPDEFVRHKMLDILGDLSLLGRPLHGHLIAVKPSHAANCELVRHIAAQMRKPQRCRPPPPPTPRATPDGLPRRQWSCRRPTRYRAASCRFCLTAIPFLMVDRVTKIEGNRIAGIKNVTINEPYFQGHFPGHPIMPGVLQLEAIAQVAGILMLQAARKCRPYRLFHVRRGREMAQTGHPGDMLVIEVELTKMRGKIGKAKGVCKVAGRNRQRSRGHASCWRKVLTAGRSSPEAQAAYDSSHRYRSSQSRIGDDCEIGPYCVIGRARDAGPRLPAAFARGHRWPYAAGWRQEHFPFCQHRAEDSGFEMERRADPHGNRRRTTLSANMSRFTAPPATAKRPWSAPTTTSWPTATSPTMSRSAIISSCPTWPPWAAMSWSRITP